MYQKPMLKEDSLKDQVIVVTGGGSGLGKSMTTYFLELGAHVVITSRNIEKIKNSENKIIELYENSLDNDIKNYRLSDSNIFSVWIGKRLLKKEIL